jgi:xanthine dehydrogenase YagR molybdenum-binding subunit
MKFDTPAGRNSIDQMRVVGKPINRIDGPLKTSGLAPYAYEHHREAPNAAYGYVLGSAVAKGRIRSMDLREAKAAPGVRTIVTARDVGKLGKGDYNTAKLFGGPDIEHYHQAIAVVVADTFEQARAAASLIRVDYGRAKGRFDLDEALKTAPLHGGNSGEGSASPPVHRVGKFEEAFAAAPVKLDERYTTPDHTHAMMEPFASIAAWNGDELTVWTSNQMIDWGRSDLAKTLGIPKNKITFISPYVGGGFGGKLFLRADAVLAALAAKAARRPPASSNRCNSGRNDHRHRAREWLGRPSRWRTRNCSESDRTALCRSQPADVFEAGGSRSPRRQRNAGSGRGARYDGSGSRDG